MCPACLANAALIIASLMSTGGLAAAVVKKLDATNGAKKFLPTQIQRRKHG